MSDSEAPEVVLRQWRVEGCVAPARMRRQALEPARDAHAEALQAGYDQGLREGREAGVRIGQAQGLEEGRAAAQAAVAAAVEAAVQEATAALAARERELAAASSVLRAAVDDVRAVAEEEMLVVCHATLCRLVGDALASPEGVRALVRGMLAAWQARGPIKVSLHPDHLPAWAGEDHGAISWQADAQVTLGGCIVRGPEGALDARLETVLDEITRAMLAARKAVP